MFVKGLTINAITALILISAEMWLSAEVSSFMLFFVYAGCLFIVNTLVLFAINLLLNRESTKRVIKRFSNLKTSFLRFKPMKKL